MPALPDQHIHAKASDGHQYKTKVSASVTTEGEFSLGVPDELERSACRLWDSNEWRNIVSFNRSHGLRIRTKKLNDGLKFLKACAQDHVTVEIETKRVILYRAILDCHFWQNNDGTLHPNGMSSQGGVSTDGYWYCFKTKQKHRFYNDQSVPAYSVGVAAVVYDKKIHKRSTGDSIEWEQVSDEDDEAITRLNSLVHLDIDPRDNIPYEEMDYSPKAANFFTEVMLAMCHIARSIDGFLGDKTKLTKAIETGGKLLLT